MRPHIRTALFVIAAVPGLLGSACKREHAPESGAPVASRTPPPAPPRTTTPPPSARAAQDAQADEARTDGGAPTRAVRLGPQLGLGALADAEKALAAPLESGYDGSVAKADGSRESRRFATCQDVLAAVGHKPDVTGPEIDWNAFKLDAVRCGVLAALSKAKPATSSFLDDFKLGPSSPDWLPAAFVPAFSNDEEKTVGKAAAQGLTWAKAQKRAKAVPDPDGGPGAIKVEAHGLLVRVAEYARADFDGDGVEDIVLLRSAFPKGGSAARHTAFVLARKAAGGPLSLATQIEPVP